MSENKTDTTTNPSLLLRIRDSTDVQSWATFQFVYRPMILAYCSRRGLQEADAQDVAQEVMSSVCRAIQKFEYQPQKGRFRAWLGTVTANKIKTLKNKQYRLLSRESQPSSEQLTDTVVADPDSDWISIFSEHIFQTACDRVLSRVEALTWDCFRLTWLQQQSAADVAQRLKIPIHNVYVNKSRVLKLLELEVRLLAEDSIIDSSR